MNKNSFSELIVHTVNYLKDFSIRYLYWIDQNFTFQRRKHGRSLCLMAAVTCAVTWRSKA